MHSNALLAASVATSGAVILSARYDLPNGTPGPADTGQMPSEPVTSGNWVISGGKVYFNDPANTSVLRYPTNAADVDIAVRITFNNNEGLFVRYIDLANYMILRIGPGGLNLFKNVANVLTSIGAYVFTPVNGQDYALRLICKGNDYRCFLDSVERITLSEPFNRSAVVHGIRASNSTGRFDNLLMLEV